MESGKFDVSQCSRNVRKHGILLQSLSNRLLLYFYVLNTFYRVFFPRSVFISSDGVVYETSLCPNDCNVEDTGGGVDANRSIDRHRAGRVAPGRMVVACEDGRSDRGERDLGSYGNHRELDGRKIRRRRWCICARIRAPYHSCGRGSGTGRLARRSHNRSVCRCSRVALAGVWSDDRQRCLNE